MGATETTYVWDWVESGTVYYYFGGRKVAMRNGTVSYLYADHLTSTNDTNGGQASSQLYYPYGAKRSTGSVATPYQYTGQRWEEALGLYFYNARWYDPALGRFLQPDTLVPESGNPQALNRYSYTLNNPVKYIDDEGHNPLLGALIGAVVGAGIGYGVQVVGNLNQGMDFREALTTDIDPAKIVQGAFLGGAVGAGIGGVAAMAQLGAVTTGAATTAGTVAAQSLAADGDPTNEARAVANQVAEIETIAQRATHGRLGPGVTVSLGHSRAIRGIPGFVDWAKQTGATYLQAHPDVYKKLDDAGKWWEVNKQFLDNAINAGVTRFHLQLSNAENPGWFANEIEYLVSQGFKKVVENGESWLVR